MVGAQLYHMYGLGGAAVVRIALLIWRGAVVHKLVEARGG